MPRLLTTYQEYVKDTRKACKYGENCYQKNSLHQSKFKHPPKNLKEADKHVNKKRKLDNEFVANDISDSDHSDDSRLSSENRKQSAAANSADNSNRIERSDIVEESSSREKDISLQLPTNIEEENNTNANESFVENADNSKKNIKVDEKTDLKIVHEIIKDRFLVHMPDDFYKFWDFCKKLKPNNVIEALKEVGLTLIGPFDLLAGKFNNVAKNDEEYLIHWRYYRDPPECQSVLRGDDGTGFHIGYFRDSPDDYPVFLVGNHAKKNGILTTMGENIFSAVNIYLDDLKKTGDPFKRMHIGKFQAALTKETERLNIDISRKTKKMIDREKKIVTRTFNKVGLVVPYDKKSQVGYRELALDDKTLNNLLTKLQQCSPDGKPKYLSELQPVFTYASIAADECDFGTSIELGWSIIAHGVECLNDTIMRFLVTGYQLLNKPEFAKITEAHMKNRRQGCRLSIL